VGSVEHWSQKSWHYWSEVPAQTKQMNRSLVVTEHLVSISSLLGTFLPKILPQTLWNVCEWWVTVCPYGMNWQCTVPIINNQHALHTAFYLSLFFWCSYNGPSLRRLSLCCLVVLVNQWLITFDELQRNCRSFWNFFWRFSSRWGMNFVETLYMPRLCVGRPSVIPVQTNRQNCSSYVLSVPSWLLVEWKNIVIAGIP
jgi:hypothetical protein